MGRILHILFLSLAVLAIGSVSYATPPGVPVHQLPTIKKQTVHILAQAIPSQHFTIQSYDRYGPDHVPLVAALHGQYFYGGDLVFTHYTPYILRYGWCSHSLRNYWPGYTRIV